MPDDKSKTRPQDAERVNVHEEYEVKYKVRQVRLYAGAIEGCGQKGWRHGQGCREGVEGQVAETRRGCKLMNLILIVLILLILLGGGGGYYYGGPAVGGGIGGLLLVILVIWLLVGRRS